MNNEIASHMTVTLPPRVKLYLRDHPENRHSTGDSLVAAALKEKFPCN
jgi:Rap1a immunity proteins